ncbi:MAG: alkaline phosphatase family protein [Bdellovibrionaceae bacterium]|nr:alkaline phosphatase family protein [Pseudobdellovibrionaceae bacterium]
MKRFLLSGLLIALGAVPASALTAAEYARRPKLVVVLVVDQFRADYLSRFEKKFLPAGTAAKPGGFRFLMQQGAWFPSAEYDVLQCMTCPGHAMIASGARPALNGIGTNDWFDPVTGKLVYCAEDSEFGRSPRRLLTTTFGDELKNVHEKSRVMTVALKDRSAIMLGGQRADLAVWLDEAAWQWTSSKYYAELPAWVGKFNEGLQKTPKLSFKVNTLPIAIAGTRMTLDAAKEILKREKLGRGPGTDVLGVSLSNHDMLGHQLGPNSPEMERLTLEEDRQIADFLRVLSQEMKGLQDVVIAFTADHGIPPVSEVAKNFKIDTGLFDFLPVLRKINERLDKRFGSAGDKPWVLRTRLFHFFLDQELIRKKKLARAEVEDEVKQALLAEPGVLQVFTRSEYDRGLFPPGLIGQQLKNSYIPGQSGDVVLIAKPFFMNKTGNAVTHMTGWSYDRTVPLILYGRAFKPGVYAGGLVIDLAPTLSFVLGTLPPAMNEGRVLKEALR